MKISGCFSMLYIVSLIAYINNDDLTILPQNNYLMSQGTL